MVFGAGLTYAFLVYPNASKQLVRNSVDGASSAIASGTQAAKQAADQQLASKK
jgi:hypothetical protein